MGSLSHKKQCPGKATSNQILRLCVCCASHMNLHVNSPFSLQSLASLDCLLALSKESVLHRPMSWGGGFGRRRICLLKEHYHLDTGTAEPVCFGCNYTHQVPAVKVILKHSFIITAPQSGHVFYYSLDELQLRHNQPKIDILEHSAMEPRYELSSGESSISATSTGLFRMKALFNLLRMSECLQETIICSASERNSGVVYYFNH